MLGQHRSSVSRELCWANTGPLSVGSCAGPTPVLCQQGAVLGQHRFSVSRELCWANTGPLSAGSCAGPTPVLCQQGAVLGQHRSSVSRGLFALHTAVRDLPAVYLFVFGGRGGKGEVVITMLPTNTLRLSSDYVCVFHALLTRFHPD